jgi:hypothetical protein
MLLTSPYLLGDERRADAFVSVPAETKVEHNHIHAIRVLPDGRRTKDKGRPPSMVIVAYQKEEQVIISPITMVLPLHPST